MSLTYIPVALLRSAVLRISLHTLEWVYSDVMGEKSSNINMHSYNGFCVLILQRKFNENLWLKFQGLHRKYSETCLSGYLNKAVTSTLWSAWESPEPIVSILYCCSIAVTCIMRNAVTLTQACYSTL